MMNNSIQPQHKIIINFKKMKNSNINKNKQINVKPIITEIMNKKITNENRSEFKQLRKIEITPKELYELNMECFGSKEKLIKDIIDTHQSYCNPFWKHTPDNVDEYLSLGELFDFLQNELFLDVYEYYNENILLPYYEQIPNGENPEYYDGFNKPSKEWSEEEWEIYYKDSVEGDFGSSILGHMCNYFQGDINSILESKFEEYIENLINTLESSLKNIDFNGEYTSSYDESVNEFSFDFYYGGEDLGKLIINLNGVDFELFIEIYDDNETQIEDVNSLIKELNKQKNHLSQLYSNEQ